MTIPILELAAVTLAVKVDRMLQKELHMDLELSTLLMRPEDFIHMLPIELY